MWHEKKKKQKKRKLCDRFVPVNSCDRCAASYMHSVEAGVVRLKCEGFPCAACMKANKVCRFSKRSASTKLNSFKSIPADLDNRYSSIYTDTFENFLKIKRIFPNNNPKIFSSSGSVPFICEKANRYKRQQPTKENLNGFFENWISNDLSENPSITSSTSTRLQPVKDGGRKEKLKLPKIPPNTCIRKIYGKKKLVEYIACTPDDFDTDVAASLLAQSSTGVTYESTRFQLPTPELLDSLHWFASHYYTLNHRFDELLPDYSSLHSRKKYAFDVFNSMDSSALMTMGILAQEHIRNQVIRDRELSKEQCEYAPTLADFEAENTSLKEVISKKRIIKPDHFFYDGKRFKFPERRKRNIASAGSSELDILGDAEDEEEDGQE